MTWPDDNEPRYVVREQTGYRINPASATAGGSTRHHKPGLVIRVADRAYGYRTVRQWATEDEPRSAYVTRDEKIARVRERAEQLAAELNEAYG